MKHVIRTIIVAGITLGFLLMPTNLVTASTLYIQTQNTPTTVSATDKQTIAAFEKRTNQYVKLREGIEQKMPKLSKDATPEEIEAHKTLLQEKVRAARNGANPGQLFTSDIAKVIRTIIREEFQGRDRIELRKTVFEAETQGVPMRVNYPYPESKELVEMPPTLLLKLPQLPKQLRYRFVGRNMLLVDRENSLIVDFMTNAIP